MKQRLFTPGPTELLPEAQVAMSGREHLDLEASFVAGEAIHTENSYKYSLAEIAALASASGTQVERQWLDSEQRFSVNLLNSPTRLREDPSS